MLVDDERMCKLKERSTMTSQEGGGFIYLPIKNKRWPQGVFEGTEMIILHDLWRWNEYASKWERLPLQKCAEPQHWRRNHPEYTGDHSLQCRQTETGRRRSWRTSFCLTFRCESPVDCPLNCNFNSNSYCFTIVHRHEYRADVCLGDFLFTFLNFVFNISDAMNIYTHSTTLYW